MAAACVASFAVPPPDDRVNSPNPALVSQREAEPLPRLLLLLFCAAYVCRGCSAAIHGRAPTSPRSATWSTSRRAGPRGSADRGRPADGRRRPAALLDRRGLRQGAAVARPALAARIPFALLLALTLVLVWYAALLARAHRGGAAAAVRLRRRSRSGRLRPGDRRRRAARVDRVARPAAARPRDDTRPGAAGRRLALPLLRSPRARGGR